ncbi:transcription antitermination factor NusB [Lacticaseibacillus saniviri]|uniref:transcription antitermination factor NusB n=1 Tax=Lacticaseibacillus saniviri TaxID=931533 RepID=UPI0006D08ED6|nr:transcription antitermination factor NusB [Lacticaseibacillus saniviri]MCG4281545.1 transcription antitermination factor NusB [Lacticaseibacillus saniviri]
MLGRHETREVAFKVLFALAGNPDADKADIYATVLGEDQTPSEYLEMLVEGVTSHQEALDAAISEHLKKNWQLSRLNKPDLIVLRLGLFEIQNEADLPDRVAINEAIDLAKKYSDDQAGKFVNGILAHFVTDDK